MGHRSLIAHTIPCSNSYLTEHYCLPEPGYVGGLCVSDASGNWLLEAWAVRRYKARFCLDQGSVSDYLYGSSHECMHGLGAVGEGR